MYEEVFHKGFLEGHDYVITNIQKQLNLNFAWAVSTSFKQASKIALGNDAF